MGAFRWNWSTPFILSESNPRTLYLGVEPPLQERGPRRHLARRQSRPDEERHGEDAAQVGRTDAGRRSRRRRRVLRHDRHGRRIAAGAGRAVGRHRRRQRADHAQRRRDVGGSREEPAGPPVEGSLHQPRRAVAPRAGHRLCLGRRPRGGRSSSRSCSRRPTTARRGRTSAPTCPRWGRSTSSRKISKNPNLLFAGTEFAVFYSARRREEVGEVEQQHADGCRPRPRRSIRATTT